nr:pre-mRNA splicing Prp18-interacting factor [Tanacetum cinerariifolium]
MSAYVLCVGCGTPLYGFSPCQWCTCERCGNDLRDGFCSLCNSRNSGVYDPNPNSFDCPPDSYHPPHSTYETYSGDSYGNDSQFGYDCPTQLPLNYEPEPDYIQNINSYLHDSSSFPQQYLCRDNCGVEASPPDSELVSSEVMEIVIPEVGEIDDDILDNSLPKFETFCFDVEEISSGSTTTHSDNSLPEYEVFHDDHVKEISSGSPTTHSDSFLYASFLFDLSINPFPSADRSDFYEFTDELIPFISLPEYDCFLFKVEPNSRDFTKDVVENISPTKEPQVHNALPTHPNL